MNLLLINHIYVATLLNYVSPFQHTIRFYNNVHKQGVRLWRYSVKQLLLKRSSTRKWGNWKSYSACRKFCTAKTFSKNKCPQECQGNLHL